MMRVNSSGLSGACIVALLIAGCGTSSPVRYYALVPVETTAQYSVHETLNVMIGPVRVAEYLNRTEIVTRGPGVEVKLAEFDRWTEPLTRSFQRILTDNLAALLGSDRVLDFPAYSVIENGYFLPAQVTRFETDQAGNAVLEVQWVIRDMDENNAVPARRSRYAGTVERPEDYDSVVTALSDLIGAFSRDAASALAELP